MSPNITTNTHRVGFVSLSCPKATVDSEHILTQLRAEGCDIVPSYEGADLRPIVVGCSREVVFGSETTIQAYNAFFRVIIKI